MDDAVTDGGDLFRIADDTAFGIEQDVQHLFNSFSAVFDRHHLTILVLPGGLMVRMLSGKPIRSNSPCQQ